MRETDDGAARWATLLDSRDLTLAEQAGLDAWLAEDERHSGALLRAQATLAYLDRARALGGSPHGADEAVAVPWLVRRRGLLVALAGWSAAAGLAGILLFPARHEEIGTAIGEVRRVPLADGSVATLNTASTLAIDMADDNRTVRLSKGEAWFRVAHDQKRPFVVEAGEVRVKAVGTAFSVRRRERGADVLVTDGIVETWIVGREGERRRIAAGSRGFVSAAQQVIEVAAAPREIDRTLSWRSGELVLDGETLGYAAAEINRYNQRKIVIEDPALAREQLVGFFRTNEPEKFSRAVASMTNAKVVSDGEQIRLIRSAD